MLLTSAWDLRHELFERSRIRIRSGRRSLEERRGAGDDPRHVPDEIAFQLESLRDQRHGRGRLRFVRRARVFECELRNVRRTAPALVRRAVCARSPRSLAALPGIRAGAETE